MLFIKNRLDKFQTILQSFNNKNHWNIIHILAIIGLLIRIFVALHSDYIHHPDEIFQYLEQAHRNVFGYSYIPWEYRFGTRSWLLPYFISIFLYAFKFFNIDDPVLYINFIKIVFCFISTTLIYSAYIITRRLFSDNAGKIAAILTCFWYELIYFSHKPTPEVLGAYLFMIAMAIVITKSDNTSSIIFGLLCALVIALRIQYIVPIGFLGLYALLKWKRKKIYLATLSSFVVITIAGYIDYITWGNFFISYYNNYLFNSVYNISSIFGVSPFTYYFVILTVNSLGVFSITYLLSFKYLRNTWLLLLCLSSVIISHSIIPHKEYRFIFLVIPIFLVLLSNILNKVFLRYRQILNKYFLLIIIFLIILLAGKVNKKYEKKMFNKENILTSYLYLYNEPDLHSILNIAKPWYGTGGYYYLHRDVPIIVNYKYFNLDNDKSYLSYISHIICPFGYKYIPGFKTIKTIGSIEIRKQINPPSKYKRIPFDTKNPKQPNIDSKYKPNIK